ncbi:MAG: multifunctional CCA addition/repair protein [Pseudohongiella sp.]|nr:multifunctional CCA addition/repair protein [Pseudohongiella sp.]
MKIYLVGGAVRDTLLNLSGSDRDWVVVGATIEEMLAQGYRPVGKDFPVFLHPESHEEYALARTERKSGKGYKGFTVYAAPDVTLEEDLQRRDLTVNAMAMDISDERKTIIDPWGGQQDIKDKLLRHVSPAFREDPLRVLRTARFAARFAPLGFTVAEETLSLMRQICNDGELEHLIAERIWRELDTALGEQQPRVFFEVLRACGALAILIPELDKLFGVPQPEQWHPEIDTGIHCLMVLEQACRLTEDRAVRLAAVLHDLGKGETNPADWPRHIAHETRGIALAEQVCKRLRVPNEHSDLTRLSSQYHTHCHRALELKPATLLKLFEGLDAFRRPDRFEKFLLVCEADSRGRTGFEDRDYPQADYLRAAFASVAGISVPDLLKNAPVAPGPQAGEEIRERLNAARLQALKLYVEQHRNNKAGSHDTA